MDYDEFIKRAGCPGRLADGARCGGELEPVTSPRIVKPQTSSHRLQPARVKDTYECRACEARWKLSLRTAPVDGENTHEVKVVVTFTP